MRIARYVVFAVAALTLAASASGFGIQGHKAIAEAARMSQTLSAQSRDAIRQIIGNDDLAAIATWADQVRDVMRDAGPLVQDKNSLAYKEAARFIKDFPDNPSWHFVNLPLGSATYDANGPFAGKGDIVHKINDCVAILEGQASKMTRAQALRFLVHLVGDIHQPLHVGIGFYRVDKKGQSPLLVRNPHEVTSAMRNDRGGNLLFYTDENELHGYWDTVLVSQIAGPNYVDLAKFLSGVVGKNSPSWESKGDYRQWAEQWATESAKEANNAYDTRIKFGAVTYEDKKLKSIRIELPGDYQATQLDRETAQLAKAALHLVQLLNQIKWVTK